MKQTRPASPIAARTLTSQAVVAQPRFPQELLDLFIDNLAPHKPGLRACALVSRDVSLRARRHLFSTISLGWSEQHLTDAAQKLRAHALIDIIDTDENILPFVQVLEMQIDHVRFGSTTDYESGLPSILTIMYSHPRSKLHTFRLIGPLYQEHAWSHLDFAFKSALCNLCISGSLSTLCISDLKDIPLLLLAKSHANLLHLELKKVSFQDIGWVIGLNTGRNPSPQLQTLVVDESLRHIDVASHELNNSHNNSPGDRNKSAFASSFCTRLEEIHFPRMCKPEEEDVYWQVMSSASTKLRRLTL